MLTVTLFGGLAELTAFFGSTFVEEPALTGGQLIPRMEHKLSLASAVFSSFPVRSSPPSRTAGVSPSLLAKRMKREENGQHWGSI